MRKKKIYKITNRRKFIIYRNLIVTIVLGIIIACAITYKLKSNSVISTGTIEEEIVEQKPKDTDIIPGKNITYGGKEFSIPANEVKNMADGQAVYDKKYVFLTFDDGPSPNTEKVLDILKEKEVHGTFFVLGENLNKSDASKNLLQRCILEGNAIANHTYTHDFSKLYPNNVININTFMDEVYRTNTLMKSILGDEFNTNVLRMPGGYNSRQYYKDPNLNAFNALLNEKNIISIDWNALNRDAEGKNFSVDQLLNNAIKTSEGKNHIVILMHDTYGKEKTAQMLPELIDYYKANGYEFKTIESV